MVLQTGYNPPGWESTFIEAGIYASSAKIYAQIFSSKEITRDSQHFLDCIMLKELSMKTMGDVLTILELTKAPSVSMATHVKPPTAKLPQLYLEMTPQQFRKSRIDWDVFTEMGNLPSAQSNIQLYNCTDEFVQNSIINTYPEFFNMNPSNLVDMLEVLVMQKSNPMVHRISFLSIIQSNNESIQNYLVQQQSGAQDYNFICPNCNHDLFSIYIKDQFIWDIGSDAVQADMLSKAGLLKALEKNISHAKAFEMAMQDQDKISGVSDIAGFWMSAYHQQKWAQSIARLTTTH